MINVLCAVGVLTCDGWIDFIKFLFFVMLVCSTGNSSNLTISNVSCSSQGIYICSPVNNISNARNGTTNVIVTGKK